MILILWKEKIIFSYVEFYVSCNNIARLAQCAVPLNRNTCQIQRKHVWFKRTTTENIQTQKRRESWLNVNTPILLLRTVGINLFLETKECTHFPSSYFGRKNAICESLGENSKSVLLGSLDIVNHLEKQELLRTVFKRRMVMCNP